jgi:hypothetical protein
VVTGASRGIGRAIATRLHTDGWAVVLNGTDAAPGEATARDLGDQAAFRAGDVGDEPAVRSLVALAVERLGRLDAVVSNAGIMVRKPVTELAIDEWRRVLDTNLTGTFLLAKHAAPHLKVERGSIVAIASTRTLMSEPDTEAYAASKGGLAALTHALAVSLGPEVRANCVSPGWIDTKDGELRPEDHAQHPAGRVGTPGDVAELVAYLVAGERSGFVTGANLVIDGGMTRKMIYAP